LKDYRLKFGMAILEIKNAFVLRTMQQFAKIMLELVFVMTKHWTRLSRQNVMMKQF
jgi:hypothetical protein